MASQGTSGRKPRSITNRLRKINPCSSRLERSNSPPTATRSGARPRLIKHHTPNRPPRPVLPSELPPPRNASMAHNQPQVPWGGTLTMPREWELPNTTAGQQQHTPRGDRSLAMSNTARDSLLQVDNAARDRRVSGRGLRTSDTPQGGRTTQPSNPHRSRRGSGASPQVGRPIRYSHEDPSRWDRDADLHAAWLDDVDRALAKKELERYAKFDREREAQQSDSPSEYSQDSPVEGQDRTSRSDDLDAPSDRGGYEAPAPALAAPYKNPLEPDEYVDVPKLALYQVATMGVCILCQRAGKRHSIIEGTLTCNSCGMNHDVRGWDDVNNNAQHQVARVPYTPRKAPSPARAEVGTMKPPPRLQDRAYANVTPLVIPDRGQRQRRRRESSTYQVPQESSSRRRTTDRRREPGASVSQLADTLHNLNPLGQVRRALQERDLADE
ncbi:hypothetical protein GE09DRAFT_773286 [Coniochaeta sp. 2T2.1]|nr:hypothetical protein GE09DRAFT_773286 [Coniochaeta sp. 2T2.1]